MKIIWLILNEVENITRELIAKDFDLVLPMHKEQIIEALSHAIVFLLLHDLEKLWNILYRIDVNEKKVKALFEGHQAEEIAPGIARLTYERLEEKALTRIHYRK